jgi:uncharacterized protein (TIGR03083 family)
VAIEDGCDIDELAAWALGGSDPHEDARVRAHLDSCADCRERAATFRTAVDWLGASVPAVAPPPGLRVRVLAAARERRPPCHSPLTADLRRWAEQIAGLDAELATLTARQWLVPVAKHTTVRGVVAHLAGNDRMVTVDLELSGPECAAGGEFTRSAWRGGAERLLRGVGDAGAPVAARPVRLAGRWGAVRPLADALVQRGFETWIHADDVRAAVGRPLRSPPAGQVRSIVSLGARLLPGALLATGRQHPDGTARLVLTGPGAGEWTIPLHPGTAVDAPVTVTVTGDAAGFCRLMAGRRTVAGYRHEVAGSAAAAADLLAAAATLGCD